MQDKSLKQQSPVGAPLAQAAAGDVLGGSGAMFDGIAKRYDFLNRVMTFGIDQRWRRRAIALLQLPPHAKVLDLATGTADLAMMTAKIHADALVTALDPSRGMLAVGQEKVTAAKLDARVTLVVGDAQHLPFADASFDGVTMGFGIRNVPDRLAALKEMTRVVKPGGRIVILEATEPPLGLLSWGARVHMRVVVPLLGAWLSGAPAEYRYLQKSISEFPSPDQFAQLMRDAGQEVVTVVPLLLGVSHLWVARVPARLG
jgi:demethylmenaquinone methyltransferase/2-methoxy-6-polyprenyl-1,4-benzoquinol methylase